MESCSMLYVLLYPVMRSDSERDIDNDRAPLRRTGPFCNTEPSSSHAWSFVCPLTRFIIIATYIIGQLLVGDGYHYK